MTTKIDELKSVILSYVQGYREECEDIDLSDAEEDLPGYVWSCMGKEPFEVAGVTNHNEQMNIIKEMCK